MKYCVIPCALLLALLGLSLWNAAAIEADVAPWCESLEDALASAQNGDWEQAERTVRAVYAEWGGRAQYLHLVTKHDALEEAEEQFAAALSYAAEREGPEFRAETGALIGRLRAIREMQEISLKNIL